MKALKASRGSQAGFTFIELMIALLVISVVLIGFVGANIMAQRNTEEMNERTIALQDANLVIENMRDAAKTGEFPENVTAQYPDGEVVTGVKIPALHEDSEDVILKDRVITVAYDNQEADPLVATVTVNWTSYTGREQTKTVETHITQRN